MDIKQYYIVSPDSGIGKTYNKWVDNRLKVMKKRQKYLKEIKSDEVMGYDEGIIHSLTFKSGVKIPDGLMIKANSSGFYSPDRRLKAGKEISKKFKSFDIGTPSKAVSMLGHQEFFGSNGGQMYMYEARLWKNKHDVIVAIIPVSETHDYTPKDGMEEITSSVFNKICNHVDIKEI